VRYIFLTWGGWKKFLAGPMTEEVVFRAAIVPLHVVAGRSRTWIVFVDPLFFGLGKLHSSLLDNCCIDWAG
jgi:prenyl protein peptidase